jgi:hypothetical protein
VSKCYTGADSNLSSLVHFLFIWQSTYDSDTT